MTSHKHRRPVAQTEEDLIAEFELLEERGPLKNSSKGRTELHTTGRKLTSYEELLTLTDKDTKPAHHVLICGNAGSGKTTLISRIAYQWAKDRDVERTSFEHSKHDLESAINQMTLVFVLDIHKLSSDETLPMAIKRQVLSGVSVDDIVKALTNLRKDCLILLDGYDEMRKGIVNHALDDEILSECFVIVTSRMHVVDEFCISQAEEYSIVKLSGFSRKKSFKYIEKFFSQQSNGGQLAETLIKQVHETPFLGILSSFPILLVMICVLWEDIQKRGISLNSMTKIYQEAMSYLNKPFETKPNPSIAINDLLCKLGKPALKNLLSNDLRISQEEFEEDVLEQAFQVGLVFKEEGLHVNNASILFIHKTFQEYCAAVYLTSLIDTNSEEFNTYLKLINISDMEYLLKFCCGLNLKAAKTIFSKFTRKPLYRYGHLCIILRLLHESELSPYADSARLRKMQKYLMPVIKHNLEMTIDTEEIMGVFRYFCESYIPERSCWLSKIKGLHISFSASKSLSVNVMMNFLGHVPLVRDVFIRNIQLTDGVDNNMMLPSCKSLDCLQMSSCSLTATIMMRLLGCMPKVRIVEFLVIKLTGEAANSNLPLCKSVTDLHIKYECSMTGNTIMKLLGCMSKVRRVILDNVDLTGEVDESIISTSCELLDELQMKNCSQTANTMMRLLACVSAVRRLTLKSIQLSGEVDDSIISPLCASLDKLGMIACSLTATTMMRLLSCMPKVRRVILDRITLTGEVDGSLISPSCTLLDAFGIITCSLTAKTMMRLLGCIPLVVRATLDRIELTTAPSCKLLDEITLTACPLAVKTRLKLLNMGCSHMLSKVALDKLSTVKGDETTSLLCELLDNEYLKYGSYLTANKVIDLLSCVPSVVRVNMKRIKLTGEVDDSIISPSCKSLVDFKMSTCSLTAMTMMRLLDCMPSVRRVLLDRIELTDEVDDNIILPSCKSLDELEMRTCFLSANTMMGLLDCMSEVRRVLLDGVELTGDVDDKKSPLCESVKDLQIKSGCSMTESTMIRLLNCFLSVTEVTLSWTELLTEDDVSSLLCTTLQIQKFCLENSYLTSKTLMRVLECMSSVSVVNLDCTELVGEVDASTWSSCDLVQELQVRRCSLTANTMMRLLGCMPSVTVVTLDETLLPEEIDVSSCPACNLVQKFQMRRSSLTSNAMMKLLKCIPLSAIVTVDEIKLIGVADIMTSNRSLFQFPMKNCSLTFKTRVALVENMSTATSISLDGVIPKECESIQEFTVADSSLQINTMMRLLGCFPLVTKGEFCGIELEGEVDDGISVSLESLQEIKMKDISLDMNIMMKLLSCMPSVAILELDRIRIHQNEKIIPLSNSLLQLARRTRISTAKMKKLLSCLPSVTNVTLTNMRLEGSIDILPQDVTILIL